MPDATTIATKGIPPLRRPRRPLVDYRAIDEKRRVVEDAKADETAKVTGKKVEKPKRKPVPEAVIGKPHPHGNSVPIPKATRRTVESK